MDSEFTYGPRSLYVDDMSKDGVSTIGMTFPNPKGDLLDPATEPQQQPPLLYKGVSAAPVPAPLRNSNSAPTPYPQGPLVLQESRTPPPPPPEPTRQTSSRRVPPPPASESRSDAPSSRSLNSHNSRKNNNNSNNNSTKKIYYHDLENEEPPATEYFSDEIPVDNYNNKYNKQQPPQQQQPPHISGVTDWYSQMEAQGFQQQQQQNASYNDQDDDDNNKELQASLAKSVQIYPSQRSLSQGSAQDIREKRSTNLFAILMIVCVCLIAASAGLAVGLTFLLTQNNDDSDNDQKTVTLPPAPTPTSSPTSSTASPTPGKLPFNLVETWTGSNSYGTTLAMDKDWIAVGSPSINSNTGMVATQYNDGSIWKYIPELFGGAAGSEFGAAVDLVQPTDSIHNNNAFLLVGAPESGSNNEGSAFLYMYNISSANTGTTTTNWELQGFNLTGEPTSSSTPQDFGFSVALSPTLVAVIGAPQHDLQGTASGRIYTYQYERSSDNSGAYVPRDMTPNEPLIGSSANARFGEDVDITNDGNWIVVGEPGIRRFSIFNFDGNVWLKMFEHSVSDQPEFGSSVTFLSSNYVAVGAPETDNNRGAIHVFEMDENDNTIWKALPILKGKYFDAKIGTLNTFSGQEGPLGPELVIGTATGTLERYDLIGNRWVQRYSTDRTNAVTALSVYNTDDDYMVLAGHGSAQEAILYAGQPKKSESTPQSQPTPAPTTIAPTAPRTWQKVGQSVNKSGGSSLDTDFAHSIALVGDHMAVGEPLGAVSEMGDVSIYDRSSNNWQLDDTGFAQNTIKFGIAVDGAMVDGVPSIVVGASETFDSTGLSNIGSAHFYQRDSITGSWGALGNPVQPSFSVNEVNANFGNSVAMATDELRYAVGSPQSSMDEAENTGKVHIYQYSGTQWELMGDPIVGSEENNQIGASVDMSKDGQRLLIGAPGHRNGDGGVYYYGWTGTEWASLVSFRGIMSEAIGTTVSIISEDGKMIAWGGPSYQGDKGLVVVYEESQPGFYTQVGNEDIVGASGDRIGASLSGAQGRVCFGTSNGSFRVYEFDRTTGKWVQVATGPNLGVPVVSISMSADGNSVAVGLDNQSVAVYDLA